MGMHDTLQLHELIAKCHAYPLLHSWMITHSHTRMQIMPCTHTHSACTRICMRVCDHARMCVFDCGDDSHE